MQYNSLLKEAEQLRISIYEMSLSQRIKGLYSDNVIWVNKHLETRVEKACIVAEELGHHHTSVGDILDQSKITNRKQEKRARSWAYSRLIPLAKIIQAHKAGIRNIDELSEFLGVTEEFLLESIKRYQEVHGIFVNCEGYTICFEPLGVLEWFE